ncbi:hypothetical protein L226DRAFT_609269 [Lentinus tigrinus ALCF2SS1-7]|uniref:Hemerythrin-like domain-containing protein n=1 Tax=Lentinus tigrinus ALCF2SS1-6 TaxID=1328759 RepID=A0A5C2T1I0_9APHY|nr:hypothetical protein L227DRAFT_606523 [Lentinus tigrinus ALCF2SS1-6]RPD80359.1 hypothetical protein L226DRAFT_609269 [Lentinus tigrinus ALCF2SS1-7]
MATASNYLEVTHEIKLDHDNVRDLFERYKQTTDLKQKALIANTLIREMAVHGDAEEVSVYNDYGALGLGDTASHNKEEHADIKKLVYDADATRLTKAEYDSILERAVTAFLTHAKEEEDEQHPLIRQKVTPEDNDRIARAFLKARTLVPTRPHPWAPQTGGIAQKAAGMQGAFHDKVVETVEGRQFVDLKYQHPAQF